MSFLETERSKAPFAYLLLGAFLLLFLANALTHAQAPAEQPANLDIILLVDNSWSMSHRDPVTEAAPSDPEELRVRAAKFLVDYLRANGDILEANFRVGVVSFGGEVSDVQPLRLLQDETVREGIRAEEIYYTDFSGPMEFAHREFKASSFGSGNKKAVILFTDGRPQLTENPMTETELEAYFGDLAPLVGDLQEGGVSLFVLGIGDAQKDRENWTELIPDDHYVPISSTTELADVYLHIVSELLGTATSEPRMLSADEPASLHVPAYLEHMTLSFMRDDPSSHITVTSPTGMVLTPTVGGTEGVHHAIYGIRRPDPGEWTFSGEEARYWVEERLPLLRIEPVRPTFFVGQPVTVTAVLLRSGEAIVDRDLRLGLAVVQPDGDVVSVPLPPAGDGRYVGGPGVAKAAGTYTMTGSAMLDDRPLELRSPAVAVNVLPLSDMAAPMPALQIAQAESGASGSAPPLQSSARRFFRTWVKPFLWFLAALAVVGLLWIGWKRGFQLVGAEDRTRDGNGLERFMDAIRSRDYADARATFDEQDEATQARWLFRAEEYVCTEELGEGQGEDDSSLGLGQLISNVLRRATASYAAGDVDALRDQCASLLRAMQHDGAPSPVRDEVRRLFAHWFGDALGIRLDRHVKLGDLLPHIGNFDELRELLRLTNLDAFERDGCGGPDEPAWEAHWEATERTLGQRGWEGVVRLWGLGDHELSKGVLRLIAQLLVETYEDDILEGILLLVNARAFSDIDLRSAFYEAVSDVLRIASELARGKGQAVAYQLCDRFGRLAWMVANENAAGASLALGHILDILDAHDQGGHLRRGEDVFGFCYLLMSLDAGRALSGDGRVYFFEEAKDYFEGRARYEGLLAGEGPLALQGHSLIGEAGDSLDTLQSVQRTVTGDGTLPQFERATVVLLLRGLQDVVEERVGDRPQEMSEEGA